MVTKAATMFRSTLMLEEGIKAALRLATPSSLPIHGSVSSVVPIFRIPTEI